MTKFIYSNRMDKELIEKSLNYNAWLILGKNNKTRLNSFLKMFSQKVQYAQVLPHGTQTEYLKSGTPGICRRVDNENNILAIEMWGYEKSPENNYSFVSHEGPHEFCHAYADILPLIYAPQSKIKNGIEYRNEMGMISQRNASTGQLVGQHYYGKLFNETMMDILSTIGLVSFDPLYRNNDVTADTVLKTNYKTWGDTPTGYSFLTSITRLAIAAFSNNGSINYQNLINQGYGIVDIDTKTSSQKILKANDFIYGVMYDPMHIEQVFDTIMGEGSYKKFTEYLDRLFLKYQKTNELPPTEIKKIMQVLPNFLNKKCNLYLANGIYSQQEVNKIIGNFNIIWNSLQHEYGAYFSKEDIEDIARKAGHNGSGDNR